MEEGDYLIMDPAWEVKEKGNREKNDGEEALEEGTSPPLDLDHIEINEVDEETLPYAEEEWENLEQIKIPKNIEPDLPFSMQTRQSDRKRPAKKYNPYGYDLVVVRIDLKKTVEDLMGLEEITVSEQVDIVDDQDREGIVDRSKHEVEIEDEYQQSYGPQLTNLLVLEWLNETTSVPKETLSRIRK